MPIVERAEPPHFSLQVTVGPHDHVEIDSSGRFLCLDCKKGGDELDMIVLECLVNPLSGIVRAVFLGTFS